MILEHRFAGIPQDARRERAWLNSLPPLFEGKLVENAIVPITAFLRYHHLGDIVLAIDESPAQVIDRSETLAAAQALDHVILRAHADGQAQIFAGERSGEAAPGDLVVLDLARPVQIMMSAQAASAIIVPRRLLASQGSGLASWHGRIVGGAEDRLARLLADHLVHLAHCLPAATSAQAAHLISATLDLCRAFGLSASTSPNESAERALGRTRNAVLRFIDAHLADVDVARLTAEFALSRRSLYRLFDDFGGIQGYIRDRRLARAMVQLSRTPPDRRRKMAQLAHECGFRTDLTFSRAFHRRYGLNPSDVISGSPVVIPTTAGAALLEWLRHL
ncbi:helix-turn-helix domain-containing protein [Methylobacterium radiotolerans]|uniref:helix-turn-helix domain-containing protein n=1 Tax=Methylobacterium radiotolerans TaxID=31998 RepID=UPI001F21B0BE|nr:helix-turn-helix domain-containing protein [Methylobacterium radiotolerans]UIY45308.1 helix-turn-helix domain-containing protein [Methylobacterium radiotolerans]